MWNKPAVLKDSRQKMAQMVESPGFTLPLNADGDPVSHSSLTRLLKGPWVQNGDLCDVMPGSDAIILISPSGERILMQNEGRATFHVPHGWTIMVGSLPLREQKRVQKMLKIGDSVEEVETSQVVLQLENIPELYRESEDAHLFR
jgi:hypothetical protein